MKEIITQEKASLFNKAASVGGIIIGISLITVVAMNNGIFILAPMVLGVLVMCIILGYFFAKNFK